MSLLGNIASLGIGELLKAAGGFAKDIRSAITGEISPDKKAEVQGKLIELDLILEQLGVKMAEIQSQVIIAEAQGQSWLQRNWRPLLMLLAMSIVANNYIIYPYIKLLFDAGVMLELPDHLWQLLKIGVGGYVVGRSAEKITEVWKK